MYGTAIFQPTIRSRFTSGWTRDNLSDSDGGNSKCMELYTDKHQPFTYDTGEM